MKKECWILYNSKRKQWHNNNRPSLNQQALNANVFLETAHWPYVGNGRQDGSFCVALSSERPDTTSAFVGYGFTTTARQPLAAQNEGLSGDGTLAVLLFFLIGNRVIFFIPQNKKSTQEKIVITIGWYSGRRSSSTTAPRERMARHRAHDGNVPKRTECRMLHKKKPVECVSDHAQSFVVVRQTIRT
ncbi:hypothetical protein EVAR_7328_1 [Eumeta japonica]|uniref:Uncharacterized protein n=1 Tax=Eumeta variegata TaxID=151549 RepID=A0A4C1T3H6_EUMVA|nr:hypothetical protein EVAR_7328_1 [Eumeta japonica]